MPSRAFNRTTGTRDGNTARTKWEIESHFSRRPIPGNIRGLVVNASRVRESGVLIGDGYQKRNRTSAFGNSRQACAVR